MELLDFLRTIFGDDISLERFDYPENVPYYIRDGYKLGSLTWKGNQCVLLAPNSPAWRLPTVKKQFLKFQETCPLPCAICLEKMTVLQRRSLIGDNVPFVSPTQQIYLPFWGCLFSERFKMETPVPEQMAPGTQLVFLYLYYRQDTAPVNLTQLSKRLLLSKATCTRAINDLVSSGLITLERDGTNKWISPASEKREFLRKAFPRLKSPVERLMYVRRLERDGEMKESGILALAGISTVGANDRDGGVAVSRKKASSILPGDVISWQDFQDFGGYVIEVWGYDPAMLTGGKRVDDISLLLSLRGNPDERIQMGLDGIRKAHGLPVQYEE